MSDTDTISVALVGLRIRERELELEAVAVRSRIEEIRELIALLDPPRRKPGRPRNVSALNPYPAQQYGEARANTDTPEQMPLRTKGGMACAEADLPSLDDVRGILRTDPPETAE